MKRFFTLLIFAGVMLQLCMVPPVSAKMYTWIDRNGVTRRTYYPPPPDQVMKENQARPDQQPISRKRAENQVELYITSWCPYCKKAMEYFQNKGIRVKVYDIEKDRNAAERKKSLDRSGGGVPFAVVNGTFISGYAPAQYSNALR